MATRCFWLEPTHRARQLIMVYCSGCEQLTEIDLGEIDYDEATQEPKLDWNAAPWPAECVHCQRLFDDKDHRSASRKPFYRRGDNGELVNLYEAPVGAMWDATWWTNKGDDGRCIVVRVPGNVDWAIDSRASNCGLPDERPLAHHCWCRHGEPPNLTVDKNCKTCQAGGGSFWANAPHGWHGHLTNGWLHETGEAVPPAPPVVSNPAMMGRRLPDTTWPDTVPEGAQERDFWYVHGGPYDDPKHNRKGHWCCIAPGGHQGNLASHDVEEHEDGLITVGNTPQNAPNSILITTTRPNEQNQMVEVELWHGFIHHGEWRHV